MNAPAVTTTRLDRRFAALKAEGRAALVTFVTAGDPDMQTCRAILDGLPGAGADVIELGMPFSDPMADGPAIQASSLRALKAGASLRKTLALVRDFRKQDTETPIVLMGYFNPIHSHGVTAFIADALAAGVDGLIVVDMPPEEEAELCLPARAAGLNFIYLSAPTSDDARLPVICRHASGFLYYVSITGITGTLAPDVSAVEQAIARIRRHTDLPIAVGFGIRSAEQAAAFARVADGVVVGTVLVETVRANIDDNACATPGCAEAVLSVVGELARGVRAARQS